jgi:hypothetical protein
MAVWNKQSTKNWIFGVLALGAALLFGARRAGQLDARGHEDEDAEG